MELVIIILLYNEEAKSALLCDAIVKSAQPLCIDY